jgi:hypothetical protein
VATEAQGQQEDRTRVICHLPLNNAAEEKAFKKIIVHLEAQRKKRIGVDGYTYSDPTAFFGRWWRSESRGWVGDKIVLLVVDYKIALTDPRLSLSEQIAELRAVIHDSYRSYGRPQEEVWVVAHHVTRYS